MSLHASCIETWSCNSFANNKLAHNGLLHSFGNTCAGYCVSICLVVSISRSVIYCLWFICLQRTLVNQNSTAYLSSLYVGCFCLLTVQFLFETDFNVFLIMRFVIVSCPWFVYILLADNCCNVLCTHNSELVLERNQDTQESVSLSLSDTRQLQQLLSHSDITGRSEVHWLLRIVSRYVLILIMLFTLYRIYHRKKKTTRKFGFWLVYKYALIKNTDCLFTNVTEEFASRTVHPFLVGTLLCL